MASVKERISALESFELVDGQPEIEGPCFAVAFDSNTDFNYVDNKAFETKWTEEIERLRGLQEVLRKADNFISMIYTYRSCSKALPQIKTQDDPNRAAIYEKHFEVLEPEIRKLKDLMYFTRDAVKLFCDHTKHIANLVSAKKKPKTISELYIHFLARMLDFFSTMDALKNMKACLNNDFSFFKRAFGFLRKSMANDDQTQENHTLYLFLAHQNSITTNLKTDLQQINGFDDAIAMIVNQCCRYLEEGLYMTPAEKHCLLRVMPYGLLLMDGDNEKLNILKTRKVSIDKFAKLYRKYPIVPLYGDMSFSLEQIIKRAPHYDEKVWGTSLDARIASEYEILGQLEAVRAQHTVYLAKFSNMINQINIMRSTSGDKGFSEEATRNFTNIVLEGLKLLSDWSGKVLRQSAWKYAHPNVASAVPTDALEYERVVRYNYTEAERVALIEFVAFIKGLAGVMLRHDGLLSPIIRLCIHAELQEFVQIQLRDMIAYASKKKKASREEMLHLRAMAADWKGGIEPDDPALFGKKVKKGSSSAPEVPERAVGPSPTQLDLMRTIVYGLVSHRVGTSKTGEYSDKDYSSSSARVLEEFLARSFFYKHLLSYSQTIRQVTELADLWYREFYLELSKRLQFPIEMSLPWILTDHVLEGHDASLVEFVLYPLDLYNDAASRALHVLRQRFLYDEIEAEVNLCFDQLIFKISEQIYTYFKIQASSILLDKPYKQQLELIYSAGRLHTPKSRFDVILRQRHFQLLGRSIDLNHLLTQRMNTKLRQNVDFAINRFEASDITSLPELEVQLNNIRLVHGLMSKYLDLDPFDDILNEINESTSLVSFHGRIVLHIIFELVYDFFPNFNYNSITQRFIRSPIKASAEVPRDSMPKPKIPYMYGNKFLNGAYANVFQLYQQFFGLPHLQSLIRIVSRTNLPLIIGECLENLNLKIQNVLVPYVRELFVGMPLSSKLPMFDYGTDGNFAFYKSQLKDLMAYPELQTAFQQFKEFGNTVVLLNLLDIALTLTDTETFMQAAPLLGITAENMHQTIADDPTTASPLYVTTSTLCTHLESHPQLAKSPQVLKEIILASWKADKFYRPPKENRSLFKAALERIDEMVMKVKSVWGTSQPDNGVLAIDSTPEFYRLWSALQFVSCLPPDNEGALANLEKFGDGFYWGGATLIYFLRQEHRFRVFDFCYHILNVEEAMPVGQSAKDLSIYGFLPNAGQVRDLNQTIFHTLGVFLPLTNTNILILHPPTEERGTEFITHVSDFTADSLIGPSSSATAAPPTISRPPPSMSPRPVGAAGGGAGAVRPPGPPSVGTSGSSGGGGRAAPNLSVPSSSGSSTYDDVPPPPLARDDDEFGMGYEEGGVGLDAPPPLPRDDDVYDGGLEAPPPLPPDDFDYGAPPPLPRDDDDYGMPPPLPDDDFDAPPPLPRD
jgi:cytoplasmic FMR1 interacting protein